MRILSMTTIPARIPELEPVLASLRNQTLPTPIVLSIPHVYRRFGPCDIPPWLEAASDGVHLILHRAEDWGPSTKLIGGLEHLQDDEDQIITVDDDLLYGPTLVENLLEWSGRYPESAIAHTGYRLRGFPFRHPNLDYVGAWRREVAGPVEVDLLGGFAGVLYRKRFFDASLRTAYGAYPPEAFWVDDEWISGHLARRGVPIRVVPWPASADQLAPAGHAGLQSLNGVGRPKENQATLLREFVRRGVLRPRQSLPVSVLRFGWAWLVRLGRRALRPLRRRRGTRGPEAPNP